MVTDLCEIRRLAGSKQAENLEFRRHLSAHHSSIEPFQILASEIQQHIDCTTCGNCCRNSIVTVTPAELDTIAHHLGISCDEAEHRYTERNPDCANTRVLLTPHDACIFLDGNRCGIYPARPKTCRDFPHVSPGTHSLGSRFASLCRWAALCPVIFNALEEYKHRTGFHPHPHSDHVH